MPEREPTITAESVQGWHEHLEDFKKHAWPIIGEHGLTFGEALLLWELNKITNATREILEFLIERDASE